MMLYCQDCYARFNEARVSIEYWGECHGKPIYAPVYCCPACGGTALGLTPQAEEEDFDSTA